MSALRYSLLGFVLTTLLSATSTYACRIPVFRYALERWPPDFFELVITHRGELSEEQREIVRTLESRATDDASPANLHVTTIDTAQDDLSTANRALLESLPNDVASAAAPQMVLLFPRQQRPVTVAWQGALTAENATRLVDSPLRRQIVEKILSGESAVWVLIDGSDQAANDAAAATLQAELARIEDLIQLPAQEILEAEEEFQADTAVELRIGFTLLRLRRDDPAESVLLSMLLATESDLKDFDEPIAIPVFGRGRTYYALVGKGISAGLIEDNCRFICGDCSCQVKEQNPGSDVLLTANWDEQIRGTAFPDQELPELTGIGGLEVIDLGQYEQDHVAQAQAQAQVQTQAQTQDVPAIDDGTTDSGDDVAIETDAAADRPTNNAANSAAIAFDPQPETAAPNTQENTTPTSATRSQPTPDSAAVQATDAAPLWWTLFPAVAVAVVIGVAGMFLLQVRS